MNQWAVNFANQKFVEKLEEAVNSFELMTVDSINDPYVSKLSRLQKTTRLLLEHFRSLDPDLASPEILSSAAGQVDQIRANCVAFAQNKNLGHIDNANAHIDNLLSQSKLLFAGGFTNSSRATSESAESILNKAFELTSKHKEEIEAQKASVRGLYGSMSQLETRMEEATRTIEQQKARLDQAIADFQKQFSDAQAQQSVTFTTSINQIQEQATSQRKEFELKFVTSSADQKKSFDTHFSELKQQTDECRAYLEKRKNEVDKIFGAIGSSSMSGNFKQSADDDAKAANRFRIVALVLMIAMIAVGGLSYYQSVVHPELTWQVFVFRLATVVVIAIPAVYAAQESSKHRDRERKNRKLEIELATIDAYLVLLPKTKQDELKEKLTERFFGRDDVVEKSDDVTKHALFELLKGAVNNLTKSK